VAADTRRSCNRKAIRGKGVAPSSAYWGLTPGGRSTRSEKVGILMRFTIPLLAVLGIANAVRSADPRPEAPDTLAQEYQRALRARCRMTPITRNASISWRTPARKMLRVFLVGVHSECASDDFGEAKRESAL